VRLGSSLLHTTDYRAIEASYPQVRARAKWNSEIQ
jgi:hypothetical protein